MKSTQSSIDEHNRKQMLSGEDKNYICSLCFRDDARWDYSYSKRGNKLVCETCMDRVSVLFKIPVGELVLRLHREEGEEHERP